MRRRGGYEDEENVFCVREVGLEDLKDGEMYCWRLRLFSK